LEFLKYWPSSRDFNKLVIKAKIYAKTFNFFFEVFFVVWKYDVIFFFLRDLAVCTKIFFSFFWQKLGIFNDVKIQLILIKNSITSARGNCKNPKPYFWKVFFTKKKRKKKRAGPGPTHSRLGLQGWPQPSHVGWADVPAHQPSEHSNQQKNENN